MYRKVFYDDENIIGYSNEIIADIKDNMSPEELADDELMQELIQELEKYDYELVICHYHPMGAYFIKRLIEEEDNE